MSCWISSSRCPKTVATSWPPARKPTYPVSLRLDNDVVHRLRVLAAKKRMRCQTLLKQLLTERLYEEEEREGLV